MNERGDQLSALSGSSVGREVTGVVKNQAKDVIDLALQNIAKGLRIFKILILTTESGLALWLPLLALSFGSTASCSIIVISVGTVIIIRGAVIGVVIIIDSQVLLLLSLVLCLLILIHVDRNVLYIIPVCPVPPQSLPFGCCSG